MLVKDYKRASFLRTKAAAKLLKIARLHFCATQNVQWQQDSSMRWKHTIFVCTSLSSALPPGGPLKPVAGEGPQVNLHSFHVSRSC